MSFQTLEAVATRTAVVRVNLLPAEIHEARAARRLKAGLAVALVGVVGVAAAAYIVTLGHVDAANTELAAEQSRTAELQAAQAPYAEVPTVTAELAAAQKVQQEVSAYDVPMYEYLDRIATGAPENLSLTSVGLAITPAVVGAGTTDPLAVPGIGTLTVAGETKSQAQVAAWMEQIAGIPGFAQPQLSSSSLDSTTGVVTFSGTATITDDALLAKK